MKGNFSTQALAIGAAVLCLLTTAGRASEGRSAAGLREDTTTLDFVRTDTVRTVKNQQVLCENYIVEEGDHIWKILRKRGHGSVAQLKHWSKVLQTLNPKVKDLNKIYAGQRLLIPLGFIEGKKEAEKTKPQQRTNTASYNVRPGDTLVKILRNNFHLPDSLIFDEILSRVRELNPGIKDLNKIRPGQRLIIPLHEKARAKEKDGAHASAVVVAAETTGLESKSAVTDSSAREEKAAADYTSRPGKVVVEPRTPSLSGAAAPVREEGADTLLKTRMASTISPAKQRIQVLADAFMALVVALGGRSQNSGWHFLPLKKEGQVTLRAESFPLLIFPSGERIFLDLNDRLSSSLEEAISENWQSRYTVVNVTESDNFRVVWQRLMEKLDGMEQWLKDEPLLIHKPVEVSIRGDWVLRAASSNSQEQKIFVINLLTDSRERTDSAMQSYLNSFGVRVVDVQLRGQLERARIIPPLDVGAFRPQAAPLVARSATAVDATVAFLDLLGQTYQRDASVPLYPEGQREVKFTVKAGVYFRRKDKAHLIDFHLLSPPILRLLEERRLDVLVIDPGWPPAQVYKALINHLGLAPEHSLAFSVSSRDSERNIRVGLPGDFVGEGGRSYLITPIAVPVSLADFLSRKGINILSYHSYTVMREKSASR